MTPREQLLEELLAERYNGGGWRPTRSTAATTRKTRRPRRRPELQWDDSEVTVRRRQRELLDAVKHVAINETEEEETA